MTVTNWLPTVLDSAESSSPQKLRSGMRKRPSGDQAAKLVLQRCLLWPSSGEADVTWVTAGCQSVNQDPPSGFPIAPDGGVTGSVPVGSNRSGINVPVGLH